VIVWGMLISVFQSGFAFPMLTASFPRGATFNIVGPNRVPDVDGCESNNVENGTSTGH